MKINTDGIVFDLTYTCSSNIKMYFKIYFYILLLHMYLN